jgi:GNAT superfamily N-acetyltransferase
LPVARCAAGDLSGAVDTIAGAFLDDPTWSWAFPDPVMRKRWWRFCIESALRYPWTFKTGGFEAVSVWIPAAGTEFSPEEEDKVPAVLLELVGDRVPAVTELLRRFDAAHPRDEAHHYLSLLGTQPAHRGRGLGMALLEENLARIDAERMPAYLESSNPANDHRYQALGFVPVVTFHAPDDGPTVTGMWRERR